jgi:hypothetical protein
MIPNDFSAFNNFNIAKHSYWEKSADEIQAFLATGQFPERAQVTAQQPVASVASPYSAPTAQPSYSAPATPAAVQTPYVAPQAAPATPVQPVTTAQPVTFPPMTSTGDPTPTRNFTGFSF